jgi:hypothetical protein
VLQLRQREKLARGAKVKEHAMSEKLNSAIAVIGIDIGKNTFHIVGHDRRGGAEVVAHRMRRDTHSRAAVVRTECCRVAPTDRSAEAT